MRRLVCLTVLILISGCFIINDHFLLAIDSAAEHQIIVFKNDVSLSDGIKLIESMGVIKIKKLNLINGILVKKLSSNAVKKVENTSKILRIEDDVIVSVFGKMDKKPTVVQPSQVLPWGVDIVDADVVWPTGTGVGVKVAVLDTGIDVDHIDLIRNIKGGYNAIKPNRSYNDDNGHGTHVAGVIAAADNAEGVIGMAPDVQIYAVKVLDAYGDGYVSDIIEGLEWSINNGINIINMSFGTTSDVQSLHDAIVASRSAGITIVAAAGNLGPSDDSVCYPAKYPETIAVSAVDKSGMIACFSSIGSEVDLAAPGLDIQSTWNDGLYKSLHGTSMAAPHVTGAVALAISINGYLSPEALQYYLMQNAADLGLISAQQGAGLVDIGMLAY